MVEETFAIPIYSETMIQQKIEFCTHCAVKHSNLRRSRNLAVCSFDWILKPQQKHESWCRRGILVHMLNALKWNGRQRSIKTWCPFSRINVRLLTSPQSLYIFELGAGSTFLFDFTSKIVLSLDLLLNVLTSSSGPRISKIGGTGGKPTWKVRAPTSYFGLFFSRKLHEKRNNSDMEALISSVPTLCIR